ncbi:MAG: imidazole glycerol phosphate synthase subunit HisH [Clostridia bacterium]
MITIIDYGAGNIASVIKAFNFLGIETELTDDIDKIANADACVLPGVGSFGDAMDNINKRRLLKPIKDFIASGKPFLGICLGLQLLFERSEESPGVEGLSVLKGEIVKIPSDLGVKVPHIGWNSLEYQNKGDIFENSEDEAYVYFVHSFYLKAEEDIVTSTADYGVKIHASVQKGNLSACQFHPEKSGKTGLKLLENFARKVAK